MHPQPETYWGHVNPIGPRGVYDEAKRYAEALTMAYHRQQGVDTAIVRIFNTYGPRMRPHDGRAIPTFIRQAMEEKPLTVFGDGSQTRSFCYVDDLIRGLILLAESGEHLPVNIGNPQEFTLLELAEKVIEVWGSSSEIVYEALPTDDPKQREPDITRARQLLGWEPEISLDEGLRRFAPRSPRSRSLSRRVLAVAAALVATAALCVPAAGASRYLQVGLFDDTQSIYGNPDQVFPVLKQLRTQVIRVNLVWGGPNGVAKRRPANPMNPNDPAYHWSVYDRTVQLRAAVRDQGHVLDLRHAALGERRRRRQRRPEERARPRALRDGRGPPLQRHVPRRRRPCHSPGAPLARLERAEQPRLPAAAVPQGGGQGRDPERDRLREDLQRDRQGHPEDDDRRLEGRLRRDRPARQQQPELEQARRVAAAVPARDEEGRRQGVRRLRAPPVLRCASRDAEHAAAARDPRQCGDRDHARKHRPARSER